MLKPTLLLICVFSGILANAQIKPSNLILHYEFSNNTLDYSSSGIHGVKVGGIGYDQDRMLNQNEASLFDGVNDYVSILDTSLLHPNFPFSLSMWVWIDSYNSHWTTIYSSSPVVGHYNGFSLDYASNGQLVAMVGNGGSTSSSSNRRSTYSTLNLGLNRWYLITAVYSGINNIQVYVNGENISGTVNGSATSMQYLSANGIIGKNVRSSITSYHHGKIDDVRLYNDALTLKDIKKLYYSSPCLVDTSTVFDTVQVIDTIQITDTILVIDSIHVFDTIQVVDTIKFTQYITVTDTLLIDVPLTVAQQNLSTLKVYPNPTADKIYIDIGNHYQWMNGYSINITNVLGQQVYYQQINTSQKVVDISQMGSTGLFHLHIMNNLGQIVATKKIVLY